MMCVDSSVARHDVLPQNMLAANQDLPAFTWLPLTSLQAAIFKWEGVVFSRRLARRQRTTATTKATGLPHDAARWRALSNQVHCRVKCPPDSGRQGEMSAALLSGGKAGQKCVPDSGVEWRVESKTLFPARNFCYRKSF